LTFWADFYSKVTCFAGKNKVIIKRQQFVLNVIGTMAPGTVNLHSSCSKVITFKITIGIRIDNFSVNGRPSLFITLYNVVS
jgi:hypothetical protein